MRRWLVDGRKNDKNLGKEKEGTEGCTEGEILGSRVLKIKEGFEMREGASRPKKEEPRKMEQDPDLGLDPGKDRKFKKQCVIKEGCYFFQINYII